MNFGSFMRDCLAQRGVAMMIEHGVTAHGSKPAIP